MKNKPQAKDISDAEFLAAMRAGRTTWGVTFLQNIALPYPPKVILAKARSLRGRGLIDGCCCGCRGDFRETQK